MKFFAGACVLFLCVASVASWAQASTSPVPEVSAAAPATSSAAGLQVQEGADVAAAPLLRLINLVPLTIADYCQSAAPETSDRVKGEVARFQARLRQAVVASIDRFSVKGSKSTGPSDNTLDEFRGRMRASLAKSEPHAFCSAYIIKLRDADVDALMAAAWEQFQAWTAAAKAPAAQ